MMTVSLRDALDSGTDSMRAEAREEGIREPISLRELVRVATAPEIFRFDHTTDVVPCSNASTTLEWEVDNVDRVVITDEMGGSETFNYSGSGPHRDASEVVVNRPPLRFVLEAIGEDGTTSRTATTTVGRILDGRDYVGKIVIFNPDESERTYDITAYSSTGGSQQVAELEPGDNTVVDEDTLTNCGSYNLEATDQSGSLWSEVSFVLLSQVSGDTWNLPPGRP